MTSWSRVDRVGLAYSCGSDFISVRRILPGEKLLDVGVVSEPLRAAGMAAAGHLLSKCADVPEDEGSYGKGLSAPERSRVAPRPPTLVGVGKVEVPGIRLGASRVKPHPRQQQTVDKRMCYLLSQAVFAYWLGETTLTVATRLLLIALGRRLVLRFVLFLDRMKFGEPGGLVL